MHLVCSMVDFISCTAFYITNIVMSKWYMILCVTDCLKVMIIRYSYSLRSTMFMFYESALDWTYDAEQCVNTCSAPCVQAKADPHNIKMCNLKKCI